MSYILTDGADQRERRTRRRFLIAMITAVVGACGGGVVLAGRDTGTPAQTPAPPQPGTGVITWSRVGPTPVPLSPVHGPLETTGGLTAGFSHDELGAVFAAIHISVRLTGQAGPAVAEATARRQTVGDVESSLTEIRDLRSSAADGATTPTAMLYRVVGGDPRGDLVAVSIALATPQSRSMGGHAELSRTLQWIEGDWRIQVPTSRPRLITSVADYTRLGGPGA